MNLPKAKISRVLVIQTSFPGDIVLTTPFLRSLRGELPSAEIFFLSTPAGAECLRENPWRLHEVIYDKRGKDKGFLSFWKMAETLRSQLRPQLTFNLHRSLRSALLARAAGAPVFGFKEAEGSFLFHKTGPRTFGTKEAQKNLSLLSLWSGNSHYSIEPELQVSSQGNEEANSLLAGIGDYFVLAPGSVWDTKRWPAQKFGHLAARLREKTGLRPVLVGSPAEKRLAKDVLPELKGANALNLMGLTSLSGLMAVIERSKFVIANDSAPLHMATALGIPVLGIFGPTTEELGFFPHAKEGRFAVAQKVGLSCRPCGAHGHRVCPLAHFRCMMDLSVQEVEREFDRLQWRP